VRARAHGQQAAAAKRSKRRQNSNNAMSNKGPLDQFYKDCLRLGTLKCFAHFSLYLKGREELVATIFHGALSPSAQPPPIAKVGSVGCDDALFYWWCW
jgi:hypothetical protein